MKQRGDFIQEYASAHNNGVVPEEKDRGYLSWLAENEPEALVELVESKDRFHSNADYNFFEIVIAILEKREDFELIYQIHPDYFFTSDQYEAHPVDLFVLGWENENPKIHEAAYGYIRDLPDDQLVEAYRDISTALSNTLPDYVRNFFIEKLHESEFAGEFLTYAEEIEDQETLYKLAELAEDNIQSLSDLEKALAIAITANADDIVDRITESWDEDFEEIAEYIELIDYAQRLVQQVQKTLGIQLPDNIKVGGPKGSYATIKYKTRGEKYATGA